MQFIRRDLSRSPPQRPTCYDVHSAWTMGLLRVLTLVPQNRPE